MTLHATGAEHHDLEVLKNPCSNCGAESTWVAGTARTLQTKLRAHDRLPSKDNIKFDDIDVPAVPVYQCILCGCIVHARHRGVWWHQIAQQAAQ